jgi:hypothetical protein
MGRQYRSRSSKAAREAQVGLQGLTVYATPSGLSGVERLDAEDEEYDTGQEW